MKYEFLSEREPGTFSYFIGMKSKGNREQTSAHPEQNIFTILFKFY